MPRFRSDHVEVHLFRRRGGRVQFLLFRRSPDRRLGGVWQPVTGKRRRGETAVAAARRETLEETGLTPLRWWALESVSTYFDASRDTIESLPVFAAEVAANAPITLSREHDAFASIGAGAAAGRFLWQAQRDALTAIQRHILRGGRLARALELPAAGSTRGRTRRSS